MNKIILLNLIFIFALQLKSQELSKQKSTENNHFIVNLQTQVIKAADKLNHSASISQNVSTYFKAEYEGDQLLDSCPFFKADIEKRYCFLSKSELNSELISGAKNSSE